MIAPAIMGIIVTTTVIFITMIAVTVVRTAEEMPIVINQAVTQVMKEARCVVTLALLEERMLFVQVVQVAVIREQQLAPVARIVVLPV